MKLKTVMNLVKLPFKLNLLKDGLNIQKEILKKLLNT